METVANVAATDNELNHNPVNIVVIGEPGCGKTTFIKSLYKFSFQDKISSVDNIEVYDCRYEFNNEMRPVRIVEIPGDFDNFKEYREHYYCRADILIFMFDLTAVETYQNLRDIWFPEADSFLEQDILPVAVLANKNDIRSKTEFPIPFDQIYNDIPNGGQGKALIDLSSFNAGEVLKTVKALIDMIFSF